MGQNNRNLWKQFSCEVIEKGILKNYFEFEERRIFVFPDSRDLKNSNSALLSGKIILPNNYVQAHNLLST